MKQEHAKYLEELLDIQKDLRKIPTIELYTPTIGQSVNCFDYIITIVMISNYFQIVLIGSPNVGKSSIVRRVSTGTPEVDDYPFTTRGVTIGHIVDPQRNLRFQVMDSPGLLDRPGDDRNEMEQLTYASMAHLPTAVMFVIDPSGLSGEKSSLEAQINVRNSLKKTFPRRPWLDVVSKCDLDIPQEILDKLPDGHVSVSAKTGQNMDILKSRIEESLVDLTKKLIKMSESTE